MWKRLVSPRSADRRVAQQERLLNTLAAGGMAAGLIGLLVVLILFLLPGEEDLRPSLLLVLVSLLVAAAIYYLSRRGWVKQAAIALIAALGGLGLYDLYVRGTLSEAVILLAPAVVFAGTAINARAGVLTALVELVIYGGAAFAQAEGWFVPAPGLSPAAGMVLVVIALAFLALVTWQTVGALESSLLQAAERERDLRSLTGQLQEALNEREQKAVSLQQALGELSQTTAGLQDVLTKVRVVVGQLGATAAQILVAATEEVSGASEQSTAIAQASATIDQVRALAEQTAQQAQGVADLARDTAEVSQAGERAVVDTVAGMEEVRRKVETIATNILALSEQAQAIERIIAAVGEIAAQSNMLALNAAVESARAGEAGRGFAVVAAEVRALAEQSRAATAQVRDILTEIQRGVNAAVMATEEGMKGADRGLRLAGQSGLAIQRLTDSVRKSLQAAQQIAAAAGQQVSGMQQTALAMQNIHQVTGHTVAGARQSEQAAEGLNDLAGQLRQVVEQYDV